MSFAGLLPHTATIVQAGSVDSYGQTVASWTSGTTATANVPGRLEPQEERETATGAVLSTHRWFMALSAAPASLLVHGAERTHRLTTVARSGVSVDAGPFDIVSVQDAAGQGHHLELRLRRVG